MSTDTSIMQSLLKGLSSSFGLEYMLLNGMLLSELFTKGLGMSVYIFPLKSLSLLGEFNVFENVGCFELPQHFMHIADA